MKRILILIAVLSLIAGCGGIQFKTTTQADVAKLAVSIGAKAIGLKLASAGFMWTDEIEMFYQAITAEDKLTLDAAQLAEKYIRQHVDPLIAPDVLELAKMIGVEFNYAGQVVGTRNVRVDMLKIAATGFRMAVQ
jgi:hypothetical protein